jgi:hypothetical protein
VGVDGEAFFSSSDASRIGFGLNEASIRGVHLS